MDTVREMPCPECTRLTPLWVDDIRPGTVACCDFCDTILVVTEALTLKRATNGDLCTQTIAVQERVREWQRDIRDIPLDVYC